MNRRDTMTTKAERRTAAAQRKAPSLRTINSEDVRVLSALQTRRADGGARYAWVRVKDIGGEGHSQHANVLAKLARHELVERKRERGRLVSRITHKGQRVLAAVNAVE